MKKLITGFASISAVALLGLAACGTEAEDADAPPAAEGAVREAGEALAGASSCSAFVQSHINWVKGQNTCAYGGYVNYEVVTHQASGLISRSDGYLDQASEGFLYFNPITQTTINIPAKLFSNGTANGTQGFSDRGVSATIAGESFSRTFGFDPRAKDQIKVTLSADGKMVFKLVTWGGGEIAVQPTECMNNLMYGFGNGALYSLRLIDACIPG